MITTTTRIELVTTYTVKSNSTIEVALLSLPDSNSTMPEELIKNDTFVQNVASSLAAGLGLSEEQVRIISISIASSRRLQASQSVLSGLKYEVESEIYTDTEDEVNKIQTQLSNATSQEEFIEVVAQELQTREKAVGRNVSVAAVSVSNTTVEENVVERIILPLLEMLANASDRDAVGGPTESTPQPLMTGSSEDAARDSVQVSVAHCATVWTAMTASCMVLVLNS